MSVPRVRPQIEPGIDWGLKRVRASESVSTAFVAQRCATHGARMKDVVEISTHLRRARFPQHGGRAWQLEQCTRWALHTCEHTECVPMRPGRSTPTTALVWCCLVVRPGPLSSAILNFHVLHATTAFNVDHKFYRRRRPQKINNMAQEPFSLDLVFDPVCCTPATMPTIALGAYHNLSQESLETVAESPVAYVTKGIYRGDASGIPVAIKSASTHPHFSKQPHDILKELRFLTKLSHVNVCTLSPAIHEALSCTMRGYRCAWAWYRASD